MAWTRASSLLFAQKKFSIVLDTRTLEEQYQFEASLFEARLPLLSPFAVPLRTSSASSAHRAEPIRFFFIPRAGPYLLFDVQVAQPTRQRFQPARSSTAR